MGLLVNIFAQIEGKFAQFFGLLAPQLKKC